MTTGNSDWAPRRLRGSAKRCANEMTAGLHGGAELQGSASSSNSNMLVDVVRPGGGASSGDELLAHIQTDNEECATSFTWMLSVTWTQLPHLSRFGQHRGSDQPRQCLPKRQSFYLAPRPAGGLDPPSTFFQQNNLARGLLNNLFWWKKPQAGGKKSPSLQQPQEPSKPSLLQQVKDAAAEICNNLNDKRHPLGQYCDVNDDKFPRIVSADEHQIGTGLAAATMRGGILGSGSFGAVFDSGPCASMDERAMFSDSDCAVKMIRPSNKW
ncbi:unnamed protein product, partial [Amoebophrya sp. A25]|eukprot:GSA25T00024103001.1